MNVKLRLSMESNTSGTDRLSLSVEKNVLIEAPLVNLARTTAPRSPSSVILCDLAADGYVYVKNIDAGTVNITLNGTAFGILEQDEFLLFPVKDKVEVAANGAPGTIEYAYWTKE